MLEPSEWFDDSDVEARRKVLAAGTPIETPVYSTADPLPSPVLDTLVSHIKDAFRRGAPDFWASYEFNGCNLPEVIVINTHFRLKLGPWANASIDHCSLAEVMLTVEAMF